MANIASLLVNIGVKLDGALKVEEKLKGLRTHAESLGEGGARGVAKLRKAFMSLGGAARQAGAAVKSAFVGAAGVGAAIGGAAFGAFKFIEVQAEAMDATNKLSASLGIEIEELQRLQYAASQSGVGADQFRMAVQKLNQNLLAMKTGGGGAAKDALAAIGVTLEQLEPLSHTAKIGRIGDALNGISDDAERSARAAQIFGEEAGPRLASLLAEGTAGLNALAAGAQGVFTKAQADQATRFGDTVADVKMEIGGLVRSIAHDLLPVALQWTKELRAWISQNRELLGQNIAEYVGGVKDTVISLLDNVKLVTGAAVAMWAALNPGAAAVAGVAALVVYLGSAQTKLARMNAELREMRKDAEKKATDAALVEQSKALGLKLPTRLEKASTTAELESLGFADPMKELQRAAKAVADRAERAKRAKGGGGRSAPAREPVSGITGNELIEALLEGRHAALGERLRGISLETPKPHEIKPTVAIALLNIANTFHIKATEPTKVADTVIDHQKRDLARAAQALANNVVR